MIGIVTVTYNSASVLPEFFRDLFRQSLTDFRLYLVDNASSDATLKLAKAVEDPRIRILAQQENLGVAEGNNCGIRAALAEGCDTVLLINNDTEFGTALLEGLLRGLQRENCDMIVPKMLFGDRKHIWCAGGAFNKWRGYSVTQFQVGRLDADDKEVKAVEFAPTCCMLIRREVFDSIGMMDRRFFVYVDDTDFCYRAKAAGFRLIYDPSVVLYHKVSSLTGGDRSLFTIRYLVRNRVFFVIKNLGWLYAALFLPVYQLYILARFVFRKDSFSIFKTSQKALLEGLSVHRQPNRQAGEQ